MDHHRHLNLARRPGPQRQFICAALLILSFVLLGQVDGLGPSRASACPNCRAVMSGDQGPGAKKDADPAQLRAENEKRAGIGKAYNYSIFFMMPLPFLLAAGMGGMLYWHMRKNNLLNQNSR